MFPIFFILMILKIDQNLAHHPLCGTGARNLKFPTGGSASGIPLNARYDVVKPEWILNPWSFPDEVCTISSD